ncbi:response regulator transcription factor [Gulosibacter molinativorax]|uniref:DNA-binding response regulator n=1 Tax=Gulosibacter molinativorax TaxID=256821 RepID=A0ABT7CAM7_9MICO|nr:response regulator transcription factor [Gulosibacter molinativorax]MDJ1372251.1 DNA-binding response regulator [Gulosibacter molinativorax]QUY63465.1 LuxR family transcriptional regulator [Gulosibacter molinativorax]
MPIRVLLVDDDPLARRSVASILEAHEDVSVVGEADDGAGIGQRVRESRPDVVLMDLRMRKVDGIEATREVRAIPDGPEVVVLTTWDGDDAVMRALEAGASGFLVKTAGPGEIYRAVRAAAEGDSVMSPSSTRHFIDSMHSDSGWRERRMARKRVATLSDRELEVAKRIPLGESNEAIAAVVHLSPASVKQYVAQISEKLGVQGRVQIAVLMTKAGFAGEV